MTFVLTWFGNDTILFSSDSMEFTMSNVVVKEAKNAYKGFLSVDSLTVEHPRFDGGSMTVTRELIRRKDCVSILPFDAISGKVMLVEQFGSAQLMTLVAHLCSSLWLASLMKAKPQSRLLGAS